MKEVFTICPYCGCGCGMHLLVDKDEVVGVIPSSTHAVNQGQLCVKGWHAHEFVNSPDRLRSPLIKTSQGFKEVPWEAALNKIASELKRITAHDGPDAIGFFSSAKCSNEENYLLMKFARAAVGTNNIDHCARL